MKFHLPSLNLIFKITITLLVLVGLGFALIVLAYSIPTDRIKEHVAESANVFYEEGSYPSLDNLSTSRLDSYTDAFMLIEAAYDGPEDIIHKSMEVRYWYVPECEGEPEETLISYYAFNNVCATESWSYSRYWHGFLVFLKPLLTIFNYSEIRTFNLILQTLLTVAVIILMCLKKCIRAVPAFIVSILMIHPLASAYCLQFSTILYVFLLFSIILLIFNEQLTASKYAIYIFFVVLGAATSYVDLLTYPIASFGMVATLYICLQRCNKLTSDIRIILNLLICWCIGYGVMFASKWVLATWLTESDVIAEAMGKIHERTSDIAYNKTITGFQTLWDVFAAFLHTPASLVAILVFLVEGIAMIITKTKFRWKLSLSYLPVMIAPIVWYLCTKNHSYIHASFTNKALIGSMFAFLCVFIVWDIPFRNRCKRCIRFTGAD